MSSTSMLPKFSDFHNLMPFRIQEILLISSKYDAFILQEDGQITEQLFNTYLNLNLKYAPRITRASTGRKALNVLKKRRIDLVVIMPQLGDVDPFELGNSIKEKYENLPVVLLSYSTREVTMQMHQAKKANFDKVFIWSGNSRIFLTIIKYIEDKMNVAPDVKTTDVRVIIFVEDSPQYYSSLLPVLYTVIMTQTQKLMEQGLNDMHKLMRMRARPKILLVSSYEEAMDVYEKYEKNVLGLLTDVRYSKGGINDAQAGFKLAESIREKDSTVPILIMSKEPQNQVKAFDMGAQFIDKNSETLLYDMKSFVKTQFGFGDFIFRLPSGEIVGVADDLKSLLFQLKTVPKESILFHATFDHFSTWLMARSEFRMAEKIKRGQIGNYKSSSSIRKHIIKIISKFREDTQQGIITQFSMEDFDAQRDFTKLSGGSIGGKARGITFIGNLLHRNKIHRKFKNIKIGIPKSILIGTDEFDRFLHDNDIEKSVLYAESDTELTKIFLQGKFSTEFESSIEHILKTVTSPLAVRSSSLLEDSHYQPFAGIYSTFMFSNNSEKLSDRVDRLLKIIKLIYSSVYSRKARAYLKTTGHMVQDEKMGVIVQQIAGGVHDNWFYPDFSGVAQSYNFFPFSRMKPEDGVAHVALGFGRMIVDDGKGLIFSPHHPEILPQFPTLNDTLKNSQNTFYALDLSGDDKNITSEDDSLKRLKLDTALEHGTLDAIGSTFIPADNVILDSIYNVGPKVVTFAPILKYDRFPLADLLKDILTIGSEGMGAPVEIEYAVNLSKKEKDKPEFYFLQIRPMVAGEEFLEVKNDDVDSSTLICSSSKALGNGRVEDIKDIIYVDPKLFNSAKTTEIAMEIGKINSEMVNRPYLLIGLGRWGSSDPWLGIPVAWDEISNVGAIVESGIKGFNIDLSMGTHFFQNMTSLRLPFLSTPFNDKKCFVDWEWLDSITPEKETTYLKHLSFDSPFEIRIDGRKGNGIIVKPKTSIMGKKPL
jgi:Pyruvate phosphate dikinase, AMP/ATP-binding domain